MGKIKVYVASPYTRGDMAVNVRFQMDMTNRLMELGFYPFTPLYYHFQHMYHPRTVEQWLDIDFVWLNQCDCLLRNYHVYGNFIESEGSDKEESEARRIGIPVFFTIDDLVKYYKEKGDI